MTKTDPGISLGYSAVPQGCLAAVVTFLEMTAEPEPKSPPKFPAGYELAELNRFDISGYRALFRKIGQDWLWHSRLTMSDEELRQILSDPLDEIFALRHAGENVGLVELDFRHRGECELAFLGLISQEIGKGLGRALMNAAIERAWKKPIRRFWVHTCTLDHPAALEFYIRSGFQPYAFQVEVQRDPRLTGHLPREAAPNVPIIK